MARPELGAKLLRDRDQATRRKGSSSFRTATRSARPVAHQAEEVRAEMSPWDAMRRSVRSWLELLDLGEAEDRAMLVWSASQKCWSVSELRAVFPELQAVSLPDPLAAEAAIHGRSPLR